MIKSQNYKNSEFIKLHKLLFPVVKVKFFGHTDAIIFMNFLR